jgi:hypothetical protein
MESAHVFGMGVADGVIDLVEEPDEFSASLMRYTRARLVKGMGSQMFIPFFSPTVWTADW